ncbi:MAG: bifunctional enoyl-CoA hydratase/phosphate acetyltransferase [Thermacetogeniaceae bacterium]
MCYKTFQEILKASGSLGACRMSVAAAHDEHVMEMVKMGMEAGLVTPVLAGDEKKIREIAEGISLSLDGVEIIDTPDPGEAALEAVRVVSNGMAEILMKGMVNTSDFMQAVLNRDCGLRNGRILSHMAVFQIPGFDRLLFITDGGVNIAPDLEQKRAILQNGIDLMLDLGWIEPRVAVVTANEVLNPKMPATLDAAALARMAAGGQIHGALVDGPLSLDMAISVEAAHRKGSESPVAGRAELLLMPDIETGNIFGKSLIYFARALMAGVVLGTKAPVILTSRASTPEEKLNSMALASLAKLRSAQTQGEASCKTPTSSA